MYELLKMHDMEAVIDHLVGGFIVILICWTFVLLANILDFWSGRNTARALGEKIDSKGARRTFTKVVDYYRVLSFGLLFDLIGSFFDFYAMPFVSVLGALAVISIECLSVIENSRRKKSHAADVPEMVKKIVQCATTDDGQKVLEMIVAEVNKQRDEDK